MKKIIVACGGAVATSTIAAEKIKELCKAAGITLEIVQCRVSEIGSFLEGIDLIVTTSKVKKDYGIPLVHATAFISGIGVEKVEEAIMGYLK